MVMYENVKQRRVGLNVVLEPGFVLRNPIEERESGLGIERVEIEREDGGDMGWGYGRD